MIQQESESLRNLVPNFLAQALPHQNLGAKEKVPPLALEVVAVAPFPVMIISSDDPTVQLAVEAPEGRSSGKPTCQQSRDTEFCQPTGGHWEPRYGMVFPHAVVICDTVFVWSCSRLLALQHIWEAEFKANREAAL